MPAKPRRHRAPARDAGLAVATLSLLFLGGCPSPVAPPPGSFSDSYTGTGPQVFHVPASGGYTFTYSLDLSAAAEPVDVYFIFTNASTAYTRTNPAVQTLSGAASLASGMGRVRDLAESPSLPGGMATRGTPQISAFNADPAAFLPPSAASRDLAAPPLPPPQLDTVGDTDYFKYDSAATADLIGATCRSVVVDAEENRTLSIWVADECWQGAGVKQYEITQDMVDALAGRFLNSGSSDDIYRWVTNIYGPEWGAHAYSALIAAEDQITILLYDVQGDDDEFLSSGGVAGFFWAKDNYRNTAAFTYSNERVMFYIDAVMLACPEDSWGISDSWPSEVVATLAHEFQHMINFYQKSVLRTNLRGTDTWINEMLSMATEDIVANKIEADGPRGVLYSDYTAGNAPNVQGRLPLYNYYNDYQLTYWPADPFDPEALLSYSINYAFGAYLTRNYTGGTGGSAEFLRNVVQNRYTDYEALEFAAAQAGSTDTFGLMLQKWGAAVLLSDATTVPAGYAYNRGTSVDSTLSSLTYRLGSINLHNYRYYYDDNSEPPQPVYYDGPYLYTGTNVAIGYADGHLPSSNLYYEVGTGLTADRLERDVYMGTGVKLTVVVK